MIPACGTRHFIPPQHVAISINSVQMRKLTDKTTSQSEVVAKWDSGLLKLVCGTMAPRGGGG